MRLRVITVTVMSCLGWSIVAAVQSGAPTADPCALVSRTEVEQIVGKLKQAPSGYVHERAKQCNYELANGGEMDVWLFPAEGLERAKKSHKGLTAVTDLGTEALQRRDEDTGAFEIYARKNGVTLEIAMKATGDADKVKALVRKALASL